MPDDMKRFLEDLELSLRAIGLELSSVAAKVNIAAALVRERLEADLPVYPYRCPDCGHEDPAADHGQECPNCGR
jgi:predicted Zn-ribbon and HTH transcriptional regulator